MLLSYLVPTCSKYDLGETEDRDHILFKCPAYAADRQLYLHLFGIIEASDLQAAHKFTGFCKSYVILKSNELNSLAKRDRSITNRDRKSVFSMSVIPIGTGTSTDSSTEVLNKSVPVPIRISNFLVDTHRYWQQLVFIHFFKFCL